MKYAIVVWSANRQARAKFVSDRAKSSHQSSPIKTKKRRKLLNMDIKSTMLEIISITIGYSIKEQVFGAILICFKYLFSVYLYFMYYFHIHV